MEFSNNGMYSSIKSKLLGSIQKERDVLTAILSNTAAQLHQLHWFWQIVYRHLQFSVFLCSSKPEFENFALKKILLREPFWVLISCQVVVA